MLASERVSLRGPIAPTPLLVVHGTVDLFLWPEFAQRVYDGAGGDKEIALSTPRS